MTGFRFLHLADLHLETSFGGRPSTRERLRRAALEAFENAVDYAIDHRLHAVLAAGDLYDDPLLSLQTELAIQRQVQRLEEAGVWFLAVCGNHDPGGPRHRSIRLSLETDAAGAPSGRVHVFRDRQPQRVTVSDRDGTPVGVVVGAGHPSDAESENLAASFPSVETDLPLVGLLHTHVESTPVAGKHALYAPSGLRDFERAEYSYWALGHIHIRQCAVPGQPVHYAGNLQGRNPRETGQKGGLVVEAQPGVAAEPQFVRFAPVRWEKVRVDRLADCASPRALVTQLAEAVGALGAAGDELIVRIELSGETPLAPLLRKPEEREAIEEDLETTTGALEIQLRDAGVIRPIDRRELRESPSAIARALELIEQAAHDDALLEALAPDELAAAVDPSERVAYLRKLLSDLPEELIERSFEPAEL
jgi:DNA repair exonuclease SbcCD nuclease subunit